jgi:predicted DNA-binding protein
MKQWAEMRNKRGTGRFHNKMLSIKIPDSIHKLLKQEARKKRMTMSVYVKSILEKALKEAT